jgi:hypothetical protein
MGQFLLSISVCSATGKTSQRDWVCYDMRWHGWGNCFNAVQADRPLFFFPFLDPLILCPWPLWSSGKSSWLQIQRSGFDSRCYQIFLDVVGLERGPLSLVSAIEELFGRKSSGCGLKNRDYGRKGSAALTPPLYPQKLALTSPTSGGRSISIVRSRTQATEFAISSVTEIFCSTLHSRIVTFMRQWHIAFYVGNVKDSERERWRAEEGEG